MASTVILLIECPFHANKKVSRLFVDKESFFKWQNGMPVQTAFPTLSATARETILSGACSSCQDDLFNENED